MNKERAQEILDRFEGRRILVVGDVMLDEYVWGRVSRVSPEAPVLVVDADHHTYVPGGAANVVNNLCALGAKAAIAGIVGADSAGRTLSEKLQEEGATVEGLISSQNRPTTQKTRIIAHSQQVVRVDHEKRDPIDDTEKAQITSYLEQAIPDCEGLLLSDYQKGLLGRDVVQKAVNRAEETGKLSAGNLKPQGIGPHCHLTVITLNLSEASVATGLLLSEESGEGMIREAGRMLLRKSGAANILVTRGARGLTLFSRDGTSMSVAAHPVAVYDVAGAGDTVISTLILALVAGATAQEAVVLANCAGAVVVRKVGVATASRDEIFSLVSETSE